MKRSKEYEKNKEIKESTSEYWVLKEKENPWKTEGSSESGE